jgi:hypothetical protein
LACAVEPAASSVPVAHPVDVVAPAALDEPAVLEEPPPALGDDDPPLLVLELHPASATVVAATSAANE